MPTAPQVKPFAPAPVRVRHYTPKEFSAALAEVGIGLCEEVIQRRCGLCPSHPQAIATNIHFPRRHYIPESELFRLSGITEATG